MSVCNLEANQDLKISLENLVNGLIKEQSKETVFSPEAITQVIYDRLNKALGTENALGIVYHTPRLIFDIILDNPVYDMESFMKKGYDSTKFYNEVVVPLEQSEDKMKAIAGIVKAPILSVTETEIIISNQPASGSITIKAAPTTTTRQERRNVVDNVKATTQETAEEVVVGTELVPLKNQTDADKLFHQIILSNIIAARSDYDTPFTEVEYTVTTEKGAKISHTGFKLKGMLERELAIEVGEDKVRQGRSSQLKNRIAVTVITDKDDNVLYFNPDGSVDKSKTTGRPVYFWVRALAVIKNNGEVIRNEKKIQLLKNSAMNTAALMKTEFDEEAFDRRVNETIELVKRITGKNESQEPEVVELVITGGSRGAYTDPDNLSPAEQKIVQSTLDQFDLYLHEKKITLSSFARKLDGADVIMDLPGIPFDGLDVPVSMKNTEFIGKQDPSLLDNIVDVLTEEIRTSQGVMTPSQKIDYIAKFINPKNEGTKRTKAYSIGTNKVGTKDELFINLAGINVNLANKGEAKKLLKEFLGANVYIHFHQKSFDALSYKYLDLVKTDTGIEGIYEDLSYWDFIAPKMTPRIVRDTSNNRPVIINGYFTYEEEGYEEDISDQVKATEKEVKKTDIPTTKKEEEDEWGKMLRSKLLQSTASPAQKAAAEKWWKESGLSTAVDADGKPLFSFHELFNTINSNAWAQFSGSAITLFQGSDYTHTYHEAWHAFSQVYLTYAERTKLYEGVSKLKGNFEVVKRIGGAAGNTFEVTTIPFNTATRQEAEEFIAEQFRIYAMNGGKFKVKSNDKTTLLGKLFARIWRALKRLIGGATDINVYSNPGSQGFLTEMFNTLYIAKSPKDLNQFSPSLNNAEFGTLNSGILDDKGETILTLSEALLLSRTIDGIISDKTTALVQDGQYSAVSMILSDPKKIISLYRLALSKLNARAKELIPQSQALGVKIDDLLGQAKALTNAKASDTEIAKLSEQIVKLQTKKVLLDNSIKLLTTATKAEIYGDEASLVEGKDTVGSVISFHKNNSAFADIIAKVKKEDLTGDPMEWDESDETTEGTLGRINDTPANGVASEELANHLVIYLVKSLTKQNKETGQPELNELGFAEPIDFKPFWRVLMDKASGETSMIDLYHKLDEAGEKVHPLFHQLLNKISKIDPSKGTAYSQLEGMFAEGSVISDLWLKLLQSLNLHRTDLVTTQVVFNDKTQEFEVKVGKTTSEHLPIINKDWPTKFQLEPVGEYIKKDNDGVNYINLKNVAAKFIVEGTNIAGETTYTVKKEDYIPFLNSIGLYLTNNGEIREALQESDVKHIVTAIGRKAASEVGAVKLKTEGISNIAMFLNTSHNVMVDGEMVNIKTLNTSLNEIGALEAAHSDIYATGMRFTATRELKSTHSLNSTTTQMIKALNKAKQKGDLFINYENSDRLDVADFMHMNKLNPANNPMGGALITMNSLFDKVVGTKKAKNGINIYDLSGTQFKGPDGMSRGVAYAKMSPTDKALTSILATLSGGFMETIIPGDKSTYMSMKLDRIDTYDLKDLSYLYVDTHAFLKNTDGEYLKGYDPMQEVLNIMYPYLEAEIKRIAMIKADPEYYNKIKGFKNADKFNIFDEILDSIEHGSAIKDELASKRFSNKLNKDGSLLKVLAKDKALKAKIDSEILEYFDTLQKDRYEKNIFQPVFGDTDVLPDVIKNIVLKNVTDKSELGEVEYTNNAGAVLSSMDANIKYAAMRSFMINNFIHKIETSTIFHSDTFQFNHEVDELTKRIPGSQSGGRIFATDSLAQLIINNKVKRPYEEALLKKSIAEGGIIRKTGLPSAIRSYRGLFNTAVIKESNVDSVYIEMYEKLFRRDLEKKGYTDEVEIAKVLYGVSDAGVVGNNKTNKEGKYINLHKGGKLKPFTEIQDGDGQGWITFDSYRILKKLEGEWGDPQEDAFQAIVRGESLSAFELAEIFPVYKLQYYGPLATETGRYPVEAFHKFSLFPLIPSVIKDFPAEQMHKAMIAQNIDYATFPSGSKKSFIIAKADQFGDAIFDDHSSDIMDHTQIELTSNPIYVAYLKNQTDVSSKFKNSSTFSSQLRKLITGGLYKFGVPVDYLDKHNFKSDEEAIEAWEKVADKKAASNFHRLSEKFTDSLSRLVAYKKQELLDELGHIENADGSVTSVDKMKTMITFLVKELKKQGFADHELSIFNADNPEKIDLSVSALAPRFEKLLMSVVNTRLVKIKLNGEPLVQLSSAFMQRFRKPTKKELRENGAFGTNGLRSYVTDPDKNTLGFMFKRALNRMDERLFKTSYFVLDEKSGAYVKKGNIAVWEVVKDDKGVVVLGKDGKPKKKINFDKSFTRLNAMLRLDVWRNDDENYKKIRLTGVRIPVQGDNSMEFGEVAEFLRPEAGTVIIIPAEIVTKSGGDFDVDKLTTYLPYITKSGKLLKDVPEEELDATITRLQAKFDKLKDSQEVTKELDNKKSVKWLGIKTSLDSFRKAVSDKASSTQINAKNLSNFTNENDEKLIEFLKDPKQEEFAKTHFKKAYKVYEKEIKGINLDEFRDVEGALEKFYEEQTEFGKVSKELNDAKEHKNNYESGITNELIENMISIMELPEKAASLMSPNDTNIVKPHARKLEKIIQKADNLTDFTKSVKTGNKLRNKGISSTNSYTEDYNLKKQQENISSKGSLSIAAVDNYVNVLLNLAGTTMNKSAKIMAKVNTERGEEQKQKKVDISLKLQHNTLYGKISLGHLLDKKGEHSVAEIISQLMNGFLDAGKDAFVVYLQGNVNVIPKILFLLEAGVPFVDVANFVSNPMTRTYIKDKNKRSSILSPILFGSEHKTDPAQVTKDAKEAILSGIELPLDAKSNIDNLYGLSVALDHYAKPNYFSSEGLNAVVQSKYNTADDAQIAGFLQYLYVEKLIEDYDDVKRVLTPDTKPNTELHSAEARMRNIAKTQESRTIDSSLTYYAKERSIISPFFIQQFATNLFNKLFKLRSDKHVTKFLLDRTDKIRTKPAARLNLKKTGYDEETYIIKFKNFIAQYIFANELSQWDATNGEITDRTPFTAQSKFYKGEAISQDFFDDVNDDFDNGYWKIGDLHYQSYTKRDHYLAPVNSEAFKTKGANDRAAFIEFVLEREYLRRQIGTRQNDVEGTKEFELRKRRLINKGSILYVKHEGEDNDTYNNRINPKVYEDYLMNKALTNTYNIWQLFRSGDNTVAQELKDIVDNYKELSDKAEFELLKKLKPIPLLKDDSFKGLLNFGLSNYTELDPGMVGDYNKQWNRLINKDFELVGESDKVNKASAYISDFFTKLPLYAFLQSGMSSGEFSLSSIMPYNNYLKILEKASEKFITKLDTEDPTLILEGLKKLFEIENRVIEESPLGDKLSKYYLLRNRGGVNIKQNTTNLPILSDSIYEKPYISEVDAYPGVLVLDRTYYENGETKLVNTLDIERLIDANPDVIFLTQPRDLINFSKPGPTKLLSPQEAKDAKTNIVIAINALKTYGRPIVFYAEGFTPNGNPIRIAEKSKKIVGIEIASGTADLGGALTNMTVLAKKKGKIVSDYPIAYEGVPYEDVEKAYQTHKNPREAVNKPSRQDSYNYKLMVELISIKLRTYPDLLDGITEEGGSEWILKSTHNPSKKGGTPKVWETVGQNWFIEALNDAYISIISMAPEDTEEGEFTPPKIEGTIALNLIENLVQSGKATTTVRTAKMESGVWISKNGNYVNLKRLGRVKIMGNLVRGVTEDTDIEYTLDEFGAAEGFDNWEGFADAAKYAGIDLMEGKTVWLYGITPYKAPKAPIKKKTSTVGFDIAGLSAQKDDSKDRKKAAIATHMIGFGRDSSTRRSSTKKYQEAAKLQGIPVNSGKYDQNTVAFVSVTGNNVATAADIRNTVDQIVKVVNAGGSFVMDNYDNRYSTWNRSGEGTVFDELIQIISQDDMENISKDPDYVQVRLIGKQQASPRTTSSGFIPNFVLKGFKKIEEVTGAEIYDGNVFNKTEADALEKKLETEFPKELAKPEQEAGNKWALKSIYYGPIPYSYASLVRPAIPMPSWLNKTVRELEKRMGVVPGYFDTALINKYTDKNTKLGMHTDAEENLVGKDKRVNPTVLTLSIGAERVFVLQGIKNYKDNKAKITTKHGNVLVMGKDSQFNYLHGIEASTGEDGTRYSITLRHTPDVNPLSASKEYEVRDTSTQSVVDILNLPEFTADEKKQIFANFMMAYKDKIKTEEEGIAYINEALTKDREKIIAIIKECYL